MVPTTPSTPHRRSSTPKSARQQVFRRFATLDPRRKVAPKTVQTFRAAEQGRENCRVGQQNVAGPRAARWHPQKAVELAVSHFSKWMRSRQVDRLLGQNQNPFSYLLWLPHSAADEGEN